MCIPCLSSNCLFNKVVAEAEKKAAGEQALREKHEARVIKDERELQEAMKKCETLEQSLTEKESELIKAHQAARDALGEAQGALQEIQEAKKIVAGKAFSIQSGYLKGENQVDNLNSDFSRGVCGATTQHI